MLEEEADVSDETERRTDVNASFDARTREMIKHATSGLYPLSEATRDSFLLFGPVGVLAGLFLVPALLLLNAYLTHNRLMGVAAVELAVGLILVLDCWRLRSRLPLLGSPRKAMAAAGWLLVVVLSIALLLIAAA
jgi:hypothetical protein